MNSQIYKMTYRMQHDLYWVNLSSHFPMICHWPHSTLATGGCSSSLKAWSCFQLHGCCAFCCFSPKQFSPDEATSREKSALQGTLPLLPEPLFIYSHSTLHFTFVALLSEILFCVCELTDWSIYLLYPTGLLNSMNIKTLSALCLLLSPPSLKLLSTS